MRPCPKNGGGFVSALQKAKPIVRYLDFGDVAATEIATHSAYPSLDVRNRREADLVPTVRRLADWERPSHSVLSGRLTVLKRMLLSACRP